MRGIVGRGRIGLGGMAIGDACSSPSDPIFFGRKAGRDGVPDWMRLIL